MSTVDAVLLAALLLFGVWGALRGALRQGLSLATVAAAFPLASRYGPRIEPTVVKAATIEGADLALVAWATVFAGTLIVGGVLIAVLAPLFGRLARGGRGVGALLGLAKGAILLTVLLYGVLFATTGAARPPWVRDVEHSHGAVAAHHVAQTLGRVLPLPGEVAAGVGAADRRIGAPRPVPVPPRETRP